MTTVMRSVDMAARETVKFSKLLYPAGLVAALLVSFAAGCIVGLMFGAKSMTGRIRSSVQNPAAHSSEVFEQLDRDIAFEPDQIQTIQEILARHFEMSESIRAANLPEILNEFERFEKELASVLSEDQRVKWQNQANWIRRNCYGVINED